MVRMRAAPTAAAATSHCVAPDPIARNAAPLFGLSACAAVDLPVFTGLHGQQLRSFAETRDSGRRRP